MDIRTDAHYKFSDRLKGTSRLDLFNEHYLCVRTRRMKRQSEFKLEVATLDPEAKKVEDIAWHWLAACAITVGVAAYFVYMLTTSENSATNLPPLGTIATLLLLAGAFALAFILSSERKWVFQTRAASCPLVVIPFRKANREEAAEFASRLQQAIKATTDKKGYSDDDLFAGEMRMLRRLSKSGVISDSLYDSAKKHMLGKSQKMVEAAV